MSEKLATKSQYDRLIRLANAQDVGDQKNVVAYIKYLWNAGRLTHRMAADWIELWKTKPARPDLTGYYNLHRSNDT